jgi:hypothetical protein
MARKDTRGKSVKKRTHAKKSEPRAENMEVLSAQAQTEAEEKAEAHIRGILIRGEAAEAPDGKLPPGATHEIVEKDEHGRPTKIVRRRFSIT